MNLVSQAVNLVSMALIVGTTFFQPSLYVACGFYVFCDDLNLVDFIGS